MSLIEEAKLTEPAHDMVHNIPSNTSFLIRCSGTGTPPPTISLYQEQGDEIILVWEWIGLMLEHSVFVDTSLKFYCAASNHILDNSGKVELYSDTHSITIDIE